MARSSRGDGRQSSRMGWWCFGGLVGGGIWLGIPACSLDVDSLAAARLDGGPLPSTLVLQSVSLSDALAGATNAKLILKGKGLVPGAVALFDGTPRSLNAIGDAYFSENINLPSSGGRYDVVVKNPGPTGASAKGSVDVLWPAPALENVSTLETPAAGAAGVRLVVDGHGFVMGARVTLGEGFPIREPDAVVWESAERLIVEKVPLPMQGGDYVVAVSNPEPTVQPPAEARLRIYPHSATCTAEKRKNPGAPSGVYAVDAWMQDATKSILAYCDMEYRDTWPGESDARAHGWALVAASRRGGKALCTADLDCTPVPGGKTPVLPDSGSYLEWETVEGLAHNASRVHIRTAGIPYGESVTSVPNRLPIFNLRTRTTASAGYLDPLAYWEGPLAKVGILYTGNDCAPANSDKRAPFYSPCDEGLGLQVVFGSSRGDTVSDWDIGTGDDALEIYLGGESTDVSACPSKFIDSNGDAVGGRCIVPNVQGSPSDCDSGFTDNNGSAPGGLCVATVGRAACAPGFSDSNRDAPGGTCVPTALALASIAASTTQKGLEGVSLTFQGQGFQDGLQVELGSAFGVNVLLSAVVVDGSRATLSGVRLPPAVGSYVVKVHSPQGVAQGTLVVTDFPTSCKAKKASDASAPDGVYMLSTRDGSAQYETHCLMSTEGGGFTLALKVDGGNSASQFFFDSPQWLSDAPYQPAKTSPDDTFEAKLRSYTEVPVGDVLLKMRQGSGTARSLRLGVPTAVPHLKAAVTGSAKATQLGPAPWLALVPGSSLQPECLAEGFANHPGTSFSRARVRLGIVGNNEEDCVSPDSFVGVGAQVDMTGCTPAMPGPPGISAGFISGVGCGGSNVGPSYASVFALVYVREP